MNYVSKPNYRRCSTAWWLPIFQYWLEITEGHGHFLFRYYRCWRRPMWWFALVILFWRFKKGDCLKFSLTNSQWNMILLRRFWRRHQMNMIVLCLRRRKERRISSDFINYSNNSSLDGRSNGFRCHHSQWIQGWICWRRRMKLQGRRSRNRYVNILERVIWIS